MGLWLEISPQPDRGMARVQLGPPWGLASSKQHSTLMGSWPPTLVIGGDIDVLSGGLLGGDAPPVDVVGALLLLL